MKITLRRQQIYNARGCPGPAWSYWYKFSIDGGEFTTYGPGLVDLRSMLRREYGREITIIESWKEGTE